MLFLFLETLAIVLKFENQFEIKKKKNLERGGFRSLKKLPSS